MLRQLALPRTTQQQTARQPRCSQCLQPVSPPSTTVCQAQALSRWLEQLRPEHLSLHRCLLPATPQVQYISALIHLVWFWGPTVLHAPRNFELSCRICPLLWNSDIAVKLHHNASFQSKRDRARCTHKRKATVNCRTSRTGLQKILA